MSGIYIPIPNKGKFEDGAIYQVIVVDGVPKVFTLGGNNIHLEHLADGIIVKDHGRLIDADALREVIIEQESNEYNITHFPKSWARAMCAFEDIVLDEPTIIPADPPVMLYPQVPGITPTVIAEEVYDEYTDTAGNIHWTGTHSGKHIIPADPVEEGEG